MEHEVDVIICATGFDTSFKPSFDILFDGKNLADNFRGDIQGYLGIVTPARERWTRRRLTYIHSWNRHGISYVSVLYN